MVTMSVIFNPDGCWPDLNDDNTIHLSNDAPPIQVAVLDSGMSSGLPSIAMRIDLPDGNSVIAHTSARLFLMAATAIAAKYPELAL